MFWCAKCRTSFPEQCKCDKAKPKRQLLLRLALIWPPWVFDVQAAERRVNAIRAFLRARYGV